MINKIGKPKGVSTPSQLFSQIVLILLILSNFPRRLLQRPAENGILAQFLFDPEQLIIFRQPVGA
jgi:hypothetical protein